MKKLIVIIGVISIISIIIFLSLSNYKISPSLDQDSIDKVKKDIQNGSYSNIINLEKKYYMSPEFYPWYDRYKVQNETTNASYGYGAYPGEVSYDVYGFDTEQFLDVYTFVHTSYGVYTYQGMKLSLKSPDDRLFETHVEPSDILLSPLPVNSTNITSNWTYKIKMTIIAKKHIPEGKYVFQLSAGAPSPEKEVDYYKINNYVGPSIIQPSKFFEFVLNAHN